MITVRVDDKEVRQALGDLNKKLDDMTPAMRSIGELLTVSTKERFAAGKSPDGVPWLPNKASTVNAYLQDKGRKKDKMTGKKGDWKKGYTRKEGLSAKGWGVVASKKPLIGVSKRLSSHIHYRAEKNRVLVGSSLIYAAVQQLGAKKGSFGKSRRSSIPWGDIPARPFLKM